MAYGKNTDSGAKRKTGTDKNPGAFMPTGKENKTVMGTANGKTGDKKGPAGPGMSY